MAPGLPWIRLVMLWHVCSWSRHFAKYCSERRSECCLTNIISASLWIWLISARCHSVAIQSASFCAVWNFLMLELLPMLLLTGAAQLAIDLPVALYVISRGSLCCDQVVPANAFQMLFLFVTRVATCSRWTLKLKVVSRYIWTLRIFGLRLSGSSAMAILTHGRSWLNCLVSDGFVAGISNEFASRKEDISSK